MQPEGERQMRQNLTRTCERTATMLQSKSCKVVDTWRAA